MVADLDRSQCQAPSFRAGVSFLIDDEADEWTNAANKILGEMMTQRTVSTKVLYPELSFEIMGAVYEVHNHFGPGFSEELYERASMMELRARQIPYEQQKTIQVNYKGHPLGIYRLDLVVADQIILELKATSALNDMFRQQLRSYLRATGLRLGILINFGDSKVQYKRIVN